MPLSDEDAAALRAGFERVQREKETVQRETETEQREKETMKRGTEATQAELDRVQREKEASDAQNGENGMKFRRERSLGTSFGERGGGGPADRWELLL